MPHPDQRMPTDPQRLPAGRHNLDPQFVAGHQRERILTAVTELAGITGYSEMTIDDVVRRAGISRRDFYVHFPNKEEAFLTAYDGAVAVMLDRVGEGARWGDGLAERACHALEELIGFVAEQPALAMLCIVEILVVGPVGVERRNAALGRLVAMIDAAVEETAPKGRPRPPALTTTTVVGGVSEVIYSRLVRGQAGELAMLLPDLLYSLLLPFLGRAAAADSRQRLIDDPAACRPA
jgi:AcrR family transcriptional regulator